MLTVKQSEGMPKKNVEQISVYLPPEAREELERVANEENRTVSRQAAHYILKGLADRKVEK